MTKLCTDCECGSVMNNLGHDCTTPFAVTAMAVLVPTFDSTGALNGISKTQTLNKAYFDSMTGHADPTKRWYPTPQFKNVENTRAEAKFWEADDQSVEFVSEAARKFMALITMASGTGATAPAMKAQIESARCSNGLSVFLISEARQILGKISADGLSVLPIQIDEQSVYAGFVFGTKEQNQHIQFSFNFSAKEKDGDFKLINCGDLADYDVLNMKGLLDICYEVVDSSTTTLKIKLFSNFGGAIDSVTADGLVVADFVSSFDGATSRLRNVTDDSNITITSVVENPVGTYLLNFTAQTAGDVVLPYAIKAGYDFTCMKSNPTALEA